MASNESRLIYGTMGLGGNWDDPSYGTVEIDKAEAALVAAAQAGIRVLDIADIYRKGSSEQIVGEVLQRNSELAKQFAVQTKCGIQLSNSAAGTVTRYRLSGDYIRAAIDASLERLGGAPIETLLLHRPDPLMNVRDAAKAIREALDDGRVERWGVSNMSGWQIELLAAELGQPAANQLELSLSARAFVETAINVPFDAQDGSNYVPGTVEYCAARGIEVQGWSPLARGVYTGASEAQLGRAANAAETATALLVSELATKYATTPETVVLWWLTTHPAQIRPVIGTTSPERIAATADAGNLESKLTRDEWYELWTAARGAILP